MSVVYDNSETIRVIGYDVLYHHAPGIACINVFRTQIHLFSPKILLFSYGITDFFVLEYCRKGRSLYETQLYMFHVFLRAMNFVLYYAS